MPLDERGNGHADSDVPLHRELLRFERGMLVEPAAGWGALIREIEAGALGPLCRDWAPITAGPVGSCWSLMAWATIAVHPALVRAIGNKGGSASERVIPSAPASEPRGAVIALLRDSRSARHPSVVDVVKELVAFGADVNAHDDVGLTVLHGAAAYGTEELVRVLLAAGANPVQPSAVGETPIMHAKDEGRADIAALLRRAAISRMGDAAPPVVRARRKKSAPSAVVAFVKPRLNARLRWALLASRAPVEVVTRDVASAYAGCTVEQDCGARAVFGDHAIFVVRPRGSDWTVAYLASSVHRVDTDFVRSIAIAHSKNAPCELVLSLVVESYENGAPVARASYDLDDDPITEDPHATDRAIDRRDDQLLADLERRFTRLGIRVLPMYDASDGVTIAFELQGGKVTDVERIDAIVFPDSP